MRIYYEAYGCTLQRSETNLYVSKLLSEGNELATSPEEADLSIIGTCVVIRQTEERMLRRIDDLTSKSKVKVLGCLAPVRGDTLGDGNIEVVSSSEFRNFYNGYIDEAGPVAPDVWEGIPINQGCTGNCNFCISKTARGKLVSRQPEKIVNQILMQLERGIMEIKLTSLDTASYGLDMGIDLTELLKRILSLEDDFLLRIGMMEPKNADAIFDRLLLQMGDERVLKFLHIPVQSGDDRILTRMNRGYTISTFMDLVKKYRERFPLGTLSTDIIVGYSGEDDESFNMTRSLIEEIKPDILNVTRFSPRPMTRDFDAKLPSSNKVKKWTKELAELHAAIREEIMSSLEGSVEEAFALEKGKGETTVLRDRNYRPIIVDGSLDMFSRVEVEITGHGSTYLTGRII